MSQNYLVQKYAAINEAPIYRNKKTPGDGQRAINKILMGTWMGVTQDDGDHYYVVTAGDDGWIHKDHVSDDMGLKMFFVDVGQGDGVLIEFGDKKMLVDAGPNSNLKNYLVGWQYTYLLERNEKVHIDYVFISHFDFDHYAGIIDIINDTRFTFGTIYHNGIARFDDSDQRPQEYNSDLGTTVGSRSSKYLTTNFDSIAGFRRLNAKGGFTTTFQLFFNSVDTAMREDRINNFKRASYRSRAIEITAHQKKCTIEFLGPVYDRDDDNNLIYKWFSDSSHTRNGHSLVLKFTYEEVSILLTGDLNSKSQAHLMNHYDDDNPFLCDVTKGCHHGSSDFDTNFLRRISPFATVISSGDNESHSHPRADAVGAAGKYSRGEKPKVYSTELARSVSSGGDILYGMINLRSLGDQIYMAQMKEAKKPDIWDSYTIIE
ncbi:MAG: MBL fold metallo-hydrolase [Bacteroidota bacterium]